jgi:hypothetical protein
VLIDNKHAAQVKFLTGTDFRTRVRGTQKQIGQKFPMGPLSKSQLPKLRFQKHAAPKAGMTRLELDAMRAEKELRDAGFEAFTIGLKFKDGSELMIPLICKSWDEAIEKAQSKMGELDKSQIQELVIEDPDLHQLLHQFGAGARSVAGMIGKGIKKLPGLARKAEAYGIKAARKAGRLAAIPKEIGEAFRAGERERPWTAEEAAAAEEPTTEEEALAEARRLQRIGVAGAEPRHVKEAARPEYTPYEKRILSAETARTYEAAEKREQARRRFVNKPFSSRVPWASEPVKTPSMIEAEEQAIRKARWAHRAPVTFEG